MPSMLQAARKDYFQNTLCQGDFQDPLESLENIIWDVAIRPVKLLFEAKPHRRDDPQRQWMVTTPTPRLTTSARP